jgi:hypothetical protein
MSQPSGEQNYYRLLQVDPAAHPEVVHAAYRALLRALGKHPDLGGDESEARAIIEAYKVLSNPARRRTYDLWLKTHSRPTALPTPPAAPPSPLPPEAARWIRAVLPECQDAPKAPFAARFDLVIEAPGPSSDRLYVKGFPVLAREHWPTAFTLCRAVSVSRGGILPSVDVVLLVARQMENLGAFLEEAANYSVQWAWNRCLIATCTVSPIRLHTGGIALGSSMLRRLQAAIP